MQVNTQPTERGSTENYTTERKDDSPKHLPSELCGLAAQVVSRGSQATAMTGRPESSALSTPVRDAPGSDWSIVCLRCAAPTSLQGGIFILILIISYDQGFSMAGCRG